MKIIIAGASAIGSHLARLLSVVSQSGANVISIHHERANEGADVNGCYLRLLLETKNYEHIEEIRNALIQNEFKIVNN